MRRAGNLPAELMPVTCRGRADQPSTTRAEPIGSAAGHNHANRNSQVPPRKLRLARFHPPNYPQFGFGRALAACRPRLPGSACAGRHARRLRHRDNARRRVSRVLSRLASSREATRQDGDGHSSGTPVAERLMRPTRAAARRPARRRRPPEVDLRRQAAPAAPTWSCSRWGFPCRRRCRRRGALLPHRFTLAARPG